MPLELLNKGGLPPRPTRLEAQRVARAALGGLLMTLCAHFGAARAQNLKIEHVTIVSSERADAIRDASVIIYEGRIAAISTGSRTESAPTLYSKTPKRGLE
jgi:hypothetical protein